MILLSVASRKLTFDEVIETSVVFYNDEDVEKRFDNFIKEKAKDIMAYGRAKGHVTTRQVIRFLREQPNGLKRILTILYLSEEKFKRIITLLRKLEGKFDKEWALTKIERKIKSDDEFARKIAQLFIEGKNDRRLLKYLPRFYRERLNLKTLSEYVDEEELIIKLKEKYNGTYFNWKGDAVEDLIRRKLESIGVNYASGSASIVDVTVDWAIPNLDDPYVIIMSSYQETTSSGQTVKARDMLKCYEAIEHRNIQHGEKRVFINFVDGGGWLARQRDLRRLLDGCHYFLNINNLDMLEGIIRKHIPKFSRQAHLFSG
jgi:hypothetical protein